MDSTAIRVLAEIDSVGKNTRLRSINPNMAACVLFTIGRKYLHDWTMIFHERGYAILEFLSRDTYSCDRTFDKIIPSF